MANKMKDSVMVQADITQHELDLMDYLVEQAISIILEHDLDGIQEDGIVLWSANEIEVFWNKLEAAQARMDDKLSKLGIVEDAFADAVNELIDVDFSVNTKRSEMA